MCIKFSINKIDKKLTKHGMTMGHVHFDNRYMEFKVSETNWLMVPLILHTSQLF